MIYLSTRKISSHCYESGSPKVFFMYFYVNTATGKKSGEVLAQAKLSE